VSAADDRKFLDWFMRAVGVLTGFAAGILLLGTYLASAARIEPVKDDLEQQRQLADRIAPPVKVAVAGRDNTALKMGDAASLHPFPTTPAVVLAGEQVYATTCIACHGAGVAGAPKFGDKGAWAPRLAQGLAVLHKHALEGFQGKSGVMPAKGGRVDLADQSILNGVDYMVNAAKQH
jgi:cytochrome c5